MQFMLNAHENTVLCLRQNSLYFQAYERRKSKNAKSLQSCWGCQSCNWRLKFNAWRLKAQWDYLWWRLEAERWSRPCDGLLMDAERWSQQCVGWWLNAESWCNVLAVGWYSESWCQHRAECWMDAVYSYYQQCARCWLDAVYWYQQCAGCWLKAKHRAGCWLDAVYW